jgi:hypothetical protein
MSTLRIGYFKNFKGADTLLVCGDEQALQQLADRLRFLENPDASPLNLHQLSFVQVHRGVQLTAYPVDRELGVRRTASASCFSWHHSQEGWLEATEKIEAVARGSAGHCYLGEHPARDAAIMVSKGEYDDAWWERHRAGTLPCQ